MPSTVCALSCAAPLLTLPAAAPPAAAAGGWSVTPSGGGRPSFYAEGTPGAVLRDTVAVTNRAGTPVNVTLSGTGLPLTFAEAALRIPARTRAEIPFTVTVLDRAPRPLDVVLHPGERLRLTEPWADRPALDAVDLRLTVTAAGGARDTADTSARFVPWTGPLTGGPAAVLAAVLIVVRRRRRRTREAGPSFEPPREQAESTGAMT
ncbi:hypothetical protein ACIQAC_35990 [Streptomyces sp. NPDC088387]|uniref:hypothetical protein n=1 Tax=Streptomyces sp. NPDC088387 TaxID=3365859 RepID=UPI00381827FE